MKTFLLPLLAGAAAGLLTGAGVGGGTALLLWLTGPGGFSQPQAQGINLLYYLACAPVALVQHKRSGLFRWDAARPAILAGLPAAGAMAFFAGGLPQSLLRRLFGGACILLGLYELLRKDRAGE